MFIKLSEKQHRSIGQGNLVTLSRGKQKLSLALKGYSSKKAELLSEIRKLKKQLKEC